MKKHLLLLITLAAAMVANADGIDRNEALMKAQRVLPDRHFVADAAAPRAKAPRTNEPYYIFNAADNGGFVIVSADDRATEILGYALQGNLGGCPRTCSGGWRATPAR